MSVRIFEAPDPSLIQPSTRSGQLRKAPGVRVAGLGPRPLGTEARSRRSQPMQISDLYRWLHPWHRQCGGPASLSHWHEALKRRDHRRWRTTPVGLVCRQWRSGANQVRQCALPAGDRRPEEPKFGRYW